MSRTQEVGHNKGTHGPIYLLRFDVGSPCMDGLADRWANFTSFEWRSFI